MKFYQTAMKFSFASDKRGLVLVTRFFEQARDPEHAKEIVRTKAKDIHGDDITIHSVVVEKTHYLPSGIM